MKEKRIFLEPILRAKIKGDIINIEYHIIHCPEDTYDIYLDVKTRYEIIDKNFLDGIVPHERIGISNEKDFTFELKQMNQKLKMYLLLDSIPVQKKDKRRKKHGTNR